MKILIAKYAYIAVAFFGVATACNEPQKEKLGIEKTKPIPSTPKNVFPFYKDIEIKPGYHFEVISWGKGADSVGGVIIMMSDSLKQHYRSIAAERTGVVTDAWNLDLDNDGNPEIYIQSSTADKQTDLNVFEYTGDFNKISFPGLKTMKGYAGNDKFYVKGGELFRSVPLVQLDSNQKELVLVKNLKYRLVNNTFSFSEQKDE